MQSKLKLHKILKPYFAIFVILNFFSTAGASAQDTTRTILKVKEWLPVPFGTIVKMTVEIVNGEKLNDKYHQSDFLFKVKTVDSVLLTKEVVIDFKDETSKFPGDEFALYKYLYGKDTGVITSPASKQMKKKYVGQEFTIMAYETGEFSGVPNGYFKYQPVRQDFGFHFRHYLIVVSNLPKEGN
ncbi:MAG TPA: hypothetical protein VKH37_01020 [Ferruginibacter sp.]|nr:hypothetical protein [Ferruginibacter sp.]